MSLKSNRSPGKLLERIMILEIYNLMSLMVSISNDSKNIEYHARQEYAVFGFIIMNITG